MKRKPWEALRDDWKDIEWGEDRAKALDFAYSAANRLIDLHHRVITWKLIAAIGWAFGLLVASAPFMVKAFALWLT